jgi:prevent-host-death family protein
MVMTHIWQLKEAKNKLSRVVENALDDGPQIITRRGVEVAVVLSYAEYQKMLASRQRLSDFFRGSPLAGVDVDLTRDTSDARDDIQL